MKIPFWRCAIISLLLWALPTQWLAAAASLPCAGHAKAQGEAGVLVATLGAPGHAQQHQAQDAHQHHRQDQGHEHAPAHVHLPAAVAHADAGPETNVVAGATHAHDVASADSHAKCASAGHCCLSAALLPAAMPDFAQRSAAAQFSPPAQRHRTPLLSGPDRPPQAHLA